MFTDAHTFLVNGSSLEAACKTFTRCNRHTANINKITHSVKPPSTDTHMQKHSHALLVLKQMLSLPLVQCNQVFHRMSVLFCHQQCPLYTCQSQQFWYVPQHLTSHCPTSSLCKYMTEPKVWYFMMTECVSPWYNCNGWLGIKHQVTYFYLPKVCNGGNNRVKHLLSHPLL